MLESVLWYLMAQMSLLAIAHQQGVLWYSLISTIELNGISNFTANEVSLDGSNSAVMRAHSSVIHIRGQALFSRNVANLNGTVDHPSRFLKHDYRWSCGL